jgi:hypothetical protein
MSAMVNIGSPKVVSQPGSRESHVSSLIARIAVALRRGSEARYAQQRELFERTGRAGVI